MRSLKNVIFITVGILIILAQLIYVFIVRKDITNQILELQNQSIVQYAQLVAHEKNLKNLPDLQKELIQMEGQKNAAKNSIPTTLSASKEFIEFIRLMESNQFINVKIEKLEEVAFQNEAGDFLEKKYKVTYTSTYHETRLFLQDLNQSYQLINIASFNINNSPQQDKDNPILLRRYGNQIKQLVTSTVEFSMFMLVGEPTEDEVYTTTFTVLNNAEDAFFNTEGIDNELIQQEYTEQEENPIDTRQLKPQAKSTFQLELWDVLRSGDNYSFVGPGDNNTLYTGLKSAVNTSITLNIREDGYSIALEDEQGNVKQNSALIPIENASFSIDSHIVKIQEAMPDIHIYINNYTKDVVNVTLKGSVLETIHIYNESKQEVLRGQTKGKVKLT